MIMELQCVPNEIQFSDFGIHIVENPCDFQANPAVMTNFMQVISNPFLLFL